MFTQGGTGAASPTSETSFWPHSCRPEWDILGIGIDYADHRFGGTVRIGRRTPKLKPLFVEFEETMGQIKMGGNNGPTGRLTMQLRS